MNESQPDGKSGVDVSANLALLSISALRSTRLTIPNRKRQKKKEGWKRRGWEHAGRKYGEWERRKNEKDRLKKRGKKEIRPGAN